MMMADEFENDRERQKAYPTMDAYCQSRTTEQLAQLIYDETHRANVFGTYDASNGQHAQSIIAAAARLSTPKPAIKAWAIVGKNNEVDAGNLYQDRDRSTALKIAAGLSRIGKTPYRVVPVTITIDEVA